MSIGNVSRPPGGPRDRSLSAFDPRNNPITAMRLGAALLVLLSHSWILGGWGEDPLYRASGGQVDVGRFAVLGFFVLSGFLVTRSLVKKPAISSYVWRRVLRIFPGFWACLVVIGFCFAPLMWFQQHGSLVGFFGPKDGPFSYVFNNFLTDMRRPHIRGIHYIDGSLWTLFDEVRCYIVLAVLAKLGLIKPKSIAVIVVALLAWVFMIYGTPWHFEFNALNNWEFDQHMVQFFVGATACLWADRIEFTRQRLLISASLFIAVIATHTYPDFGFVPSSYLILALTTQRCPKRLDLKTDLSYGVYIYAYSVELAAVSLHINSYGHVIYFFTCLAVTMAFAFASWTLVEKPALGLRNRSVHLVSPAR